MAEEKKPANPLMCAVYGIGIIVTLAIYGLLQQRIMQLPYGSGAGVMFTFSTFLVFCNRISNLLYGVIMATANGETLINQAPLWKYFIISFSNVGATTCQYEALKYVSFPVQMLGKSFKMMPVMMWNIILSGKKYTVTDFVVAFFVTGGVTMFLMTGPISASDDTKNSAYGLLLLVGFLAMDGLTSTVQQWAFEAHTTTKYNQMVYVNIFSSFVSMFSLVASSTLMPALNFCKDYPSFIKDAIFLSASATTGQFFIYSQIKDFGSLVFAATMNVRQVASILLSYYKYSTPVTQLQIVALVIVFGALGYKSYAGIAGGKAKAKAKEIESELNNDHKSYRLLLA